mmetsp:Transcript_7234/g.13731  ORF Transcript_7234/g.13731 Transcript_7234/m.13731 type:complete len:95 (-) Transcript_7234:2002-2286(-)
MHFPSFLIGSVTTGCGFLLIHRELSHRQRLSSRWILVEVVEKEMKTLWENAKSSIPDTEPTSVASKLEIDKYATTYRQKWEDGVSYLRDLVSKK